MAETDAIGQVQGVIRDIQAGFSTFYNAVLSPQGVSLAQFAVLMCLAQQQSRKMSEIASSIHVSLPAVTNLVDRLERKKMLLRKPHENDRRVHLVELTERGHKVVQSTQGRTLKILTDAFIQHPLEEQEAIRSFLHSLRRGLNEAVKETK